MMQGPPHSDQGYDLQSSQFSTAPSQDAESTPREGCYSHFAYHIDDPDTPFDTDTDDDRGNNQVYHAWLQDKHKEGYTDNHIANVLASNYFQENKSFASSSRRVLEYSEPFEEK